MTNGRDGKTAGLPAQLGLRLSLLQRSLLVDSAVRVFMAAYGKQPDKAAR